MHEDLVARKTQRSIKHTKHEANKHKNANLEQKSRYASVPNPKVSTNTQTHTNPKKETKEESKVNVKSEKPLVKKPTSSVSV